MYIGTIHAFAFKVLQDFIPIYRGYDMLDDVGRMAFLSSIKNEMDVQYLKNSLEKHFRRPYRRNRENWAFSVFISDWDKFIEEGWDVDEIATSDCFKNAYKVYKDKMQEKRFLDFPSIQRIAVDTLKNNSYILDNIRTQYQHFTVDEYQDVNPIQEELIQLISGKNNVCVVGDDDQSIYQWRGADVNNILTFQKRYPDVAVHKLETNRRSHDKIVLAAKDLIERNHERLDKSIKDKGITSEQGDLYKLTFNTQPEECQWIAEKINQLVGTEFNENGKVRKLEYSDFAILFRSISNQAQPYIDALQNADIPLIYSGTGGLFETDEISSILHILEYISKADRGVNYDEDFLRNIHQNLPEIFTLNENIFITGVQAIEQWARNQKRLSLQGLYGLILELLKVSHPRFHTDENEVLLYNLGRFSTAITDYEESQRIQLTKRSELIQFLRSQIGNCENEVLFAVFLNAKNEVLKTSELGEGTVSQASAFPRKIVEQGLSLRATSLILAHNHPGGIAEPSDGDIDITEEIKKALALVEMSLQDHIILAANDYFSFMKNGYL